MISSVAWKGERIFVCERKDRVGGARAPASAFFECRRMSVCRTVEKRDCIKVGFTLKVFDPTRVSVSSSNICTHTVHGVYKVEYGTERSFAGQKKGIRYGVRGKKSFPFPLSASRSCKYYFRIYRNGTTSIPGDNAPGWSCWLVSGLQQRCPILISSMRGRYNVHSRVNIVAAMARFAAPAKNTKCKTCSAICLPLYVASGDTNFGKHKARAIY